MMKKTGYFLAALTGILAASAGARESDGKPDSGAPRIAPDARMYAPAWMRARDQFRRDRANLKSARVSEIQALLDARIREADRQQAEARRVRNITGIRVAEEFKAILQNARGRLNAGEPIEFPAALDLRREVRPAVESARQDVASLEQRMEQRTAELDAAQLDRFSAAYRTSGFPEPESFRALFDVWLHEDPPAEPPPEAPPPEKAVEAAPAPEPEPPPAPEPEPVKEFFAETGDPEGEWIRVGRWTAEMMGPEIFRIPIYGRSDQESGRQLNPVSSQVSEWNWESLQALPAGPDYAFRLRRLEERAPIKVVHWPGTNRLDVLEFRVPLPAKIPFAVGFELQAAPGADIRARELAAFHAELAEHGVLVSFTTQPPGARIGVDGRLYRLPSGEPALTPCDIPLMPGTARITLVLQDHVRHEIPEFQVRSGARVRWQFQHEADRPGTRVRVHARSAWEDSGITVNRGDRVWVVPAGGTWVVGARGEPVSSDGYCEVQFPHYAHEHTAQLKQLASALYGSLIARVGGADVGRLMPAGGRTNFTAEAGGNIWFDVNESADASARRNNRGVLDVTVIAIPGS